MKGTNWSKRGITLAEAVVTLFLIAVVMGMLAHLLQASHQAIDYLNKKDRTTFAAQVAIGRITSEAREALEWQPGSATNLTFRKLDPRAVRFPEPPPTSWDPRQPMLEVSYFLQNAQLLRTQGPPGGSVESSVVVAEGLTGFTWSRPTDQLLRLELSVQEEKKIRRLTSEVRCPLF